MEAGVDEVVGGGNGVGEAVHGEGGAVALDDFEFAPFVGDHGFFKPEVVTFVPEGGVADDGEVAEGSVVEFDVDDGVDVDFGVDVVHKGGDMEGVETGGPEKDVDHVAAGVVDLAAAGEADFLSPGAFGELVPLLAEVAVDGADLAVDSAFDGGFDPSEGSVAMALVGEGADFAGSVAGVDAGLDVGGGGGEGFFAEDVATGFEGADDLVAVEGVGAGDDDGVKVFGGEHFFVVEEGWKAIEVREAGLELGDLGGFAVAECDDAGVGAGEESLDVDAHDAAGADQSDS